MRSIWGPTSQGGLKTKVAGPGDISVLLIPLVVFSSSAGVAGAYHSVWLIIVNS